MAEIAAAVGKGRPNKSGDVSTVQALLNRNILHIMPLRPLDVNGKFSPNLDLAIRTFQQRVVKMKRPDGHVEPKSQTLVALSSQSAALTPNPVKAEATAALGGLTEQEFVEAARRLKCEAAAIKAVVKTELGVRGAFDEPGRPTILFERHKFYKYTNGKYAKTDPDICNLAAGGYGAFSAQYPKFYRAEKLDKVAANLSCSWGAFQIMGSNFASAGYSSVEAFVEGMRQSVQKQIAAFVAFVSSDSSLLKAMRNKDWATFASKYNGAGYKANAYDTKMAASYREFSGGTLQKGK